MGVAILSDRVKPATDDEATPVCNHWAPRGDWRQRVGKEKSRNLRGPRWVATPVRESDDPIVARKGLTSLERRGSAVSVQASKPSLPPGLVPITETKKGNGGNVRRTCLCMGSLQESRMRVPSETTSSNPHVRFDEGE